MTAIIIIAVLAVIIVIVALILFGMYNGLIRSRNRVKEAWSGIDVQLRRRADLVPNLVETVKGYAAHERETLEGVVEARAKATQVQLNAGDLTPENLRRFEQAQAGLTGALSRLLAVAENYPQLKANENFRDLQVQLEGTENR